MPYMPLSPILLLETTTCFGYPPSFLLLSPLLSLISCIPKSPGKNVTSPNPPSTNFSFGTYFLLFLSAPDSLNSSASSLLFMNWLSTFAKIFIDFSYDFIQSTGAFILTTIVTMIMNFLLYDKFVFGKTKSNIEEEEAK